MLNFQPESSGRMLLSLQMIVDAIGCLGIKIDAEKNNVRGKKCVVSTADSKWKAIIMPTNEELMIARNTLEVLGIK